MAGTECKACARKKPPEDFMKDLSSDDVMTRRKAVSHLATFRSGEVVDALVKALGDENSGVRTITALFLGRPYWPKRASVVSALVKCLEDPYIFVRHAAAFSLGRIGDAHAAEPLIHALDDDDDRVVTEAIRSLGKLHDTRAADPVARFLDDSDWGRRWDSAVALARLHDPRTVPALRKLRIDCEVPSDLKVYIAGHLWSLRLWLGKRYR